MTSPPSQDWKRRFQNFKFKVNVEPPPPPPPPVEEPPPLKEVEVSPQGFGWEVLRQAYQRSLVWFNGIPTTGKLLAIAGGGVLSLALMKTVYQLVNSLISLSILAIILYLIYRFWILPRSSG